MRTDVLSCMLRDAMGLEAQYSLRRPTREQVLALYNIGIDLDHPISVPGNNPMEWNRDHSEFVLHVLLPEIRPDRESWLIAIEAYLSGLEIVSDGSSVVPDVTYRWGRIKDPAGIAHDYVFYLHRNGFADAFGNKWGLCQANAMYFRLVRACGYPFRAIIRWIGLTLGSWIPWNL